MPEGIRGAAAAEVEITRRKFMTESLLMKRERERELKKHQERIQNMKPCVDTKPSFIPATSFPVRSQKRQPVRSRIDKDKLRQIEKQNYRLLMRLRYIHKNYSLYMPKKHMYLLKGEACRITKPGKKPAAKSDETSKSAMETARSHESHFLDEEMANRVAAMNLRQK